MFKHTSHVILIAVHCLACDISLVISATKWTSVTVTSITSVRRRWMEDTGFTTCSVPSVSTSSRTSRPVSRSAMHVTTRTRAGRLQWCNMTEVSKRNLGSQWTKDGWWFNRPPPQLSITCSHWQGQILTCFVARLLGVKGPEPHAREVPGIARVTVTPDFRIWHHMYP